jgi:cyclic pyranopterin phosphate synthase
MIDCMIDSYGRRINYLRVSVTDRCNLRCAYCMPPEGVPLVWRSEILSYEEIAEVVRVAAGLGVTKVRLTGGEPLVRRDLVRLVAMLSAIGAISDLAMTTNGILLPQFARPLAAAGLHRVNISLDAIEPLRYAAVTRGGDVRQALAGIEAALAAGLAPVRLNCVVESDPSEPDARDVARFAARNGLEVRFIQRMHLESGVFTVIEGGTGGDCPRCNRLRLSADGRLRPCLFSNVSFNVRQLGAARALSLAVREKPAAGSACTDLAMHAIGG